MMETGWESEDEKKGEDKSRKRERPFGSGVLPSLCFSTSNVVRSSCQLMSTVPECWHGDVCPWHKRGRCLFKHCAPPPVELTGGEMPVEQQLRDLGRALERLAAVVMWRDGVPMPQVVKGTLETMENTPKERISERTRVVDATVPQIMEELQERIPQRMQEQVVDAPVHMTVHQPGDQTRRVPADLVHRQNCRYACGDAVKGPSDSDCFEDSGKPAGAVRRQSCGGASGLADAPVPPVALQERISERMHEQTVDQVTKHAEIPQILYIDEVVDMLVVMQRQVPRIQTVLMTMEGPRTQFVGRVMEALMACVRWHAHNAAASPRASRDACDECGEYSHIRECAACIWYACTRCTEAAQTAKLPWEARRRRGRGRHRW